MTFYHGTNARLAIGDVIQAGMPRRHSVSLTGFVYVTDSLPVARTYSLLAAKARRGSQERYVYQVQPHSAPVNDKYRNEFVTTAATVVGIAMASVAH